jgi:hypothetical protein
VGWWIANPPYLPSGMNPQAGYTRQLSFSNPKRNEQSKSKWAKWFRIEFNLK